MLKEMFSLTVEEEVEGGGADLYVPTITCSHLASFTQRFLLITGHYREKATCRQCCIDQETKGRPNMEGFVHMAMLWLPSLLLPPLLPPTAQHTTSSELWLVCGVCGQRSGVWWVWCVAEAELCSVLSNNVGNASTVFE